MLLKGKRGFTPSWIERGTVGLGLALFSSWRAAQAFGPFLVLEMWSLAPLLEWEKGVGMAPSCSGKGGVGFIPS